MDRQGMKDTARRRMRSHYWLLVAVCLCASFLGVQYGSSLWAINYQNGPSLIDVNMDIAIDVMTSDDDVSARNQVERNESAIREGDDVSALGRSRGILASAINAVSSGSLTLSILQTLQSIMRSRSMAMMTLIAASFIVYASFWLFIRQVYLIVSRRMILEGRTYDIVPAARFLYPLHNGSWTHMAWVMLVMNAYRLLWTLTLIGGIVATYSCMLVPYIVAENPSISAKEAILLSRRMMRDHKWEWFLAQMSFIGWHLLNLVTLGLSGILYSNAYQAAFFAEYYVRLRSIAKRTGLPGSEALNDEWLYRHADHALLDATYHDVTRQIGIITAGESQIEKPGGLAGLLAERFGVMIVSSPQIKRYETYRAQRYQAEKGRAMLEGRTYPIRLASVPMPFRVRGDVALGATRSYTVLHLVVMFFIFGFIGWIWEVAIAFINEGVFINRGTMHGPWLPIYGVGGMLVLILLRRLRERPTLEFLATVALCGTLEYVTSWGLELIHDGQRWWDYTGYFLNLNGRICAEGLLAFGIGGLAIVYLLAPAVDDLLSHVADMPLTLVATALAILFLIDLAYSMTNPNTGTGVTDYRAPSSAVASGADPTSPYCAQCAVSETPRSCVAAADSTSKRRCHEHAL